MAHIEILDTSKDGTTGYMIVEARVIDEDDPVHKVGAVERSGVEALDIAKNYGGDVDRWLMHIAREMLFRHRQRTAAHTDLHKWKGKRMEIK